MKKRKNLKKRICGKRFYKTTKSVEGIGRQVGGPMYNIALLVMISPLQSPSSFEYEEGKKSERGIGVDEIQVLV